ncbi:MAG TPA: cytochrome c biogenesis protein CcsA [Geobacteraceae bacterium]|nr:cytochrome c biogenesis protein CcsA [Geobacteraceae bacterium]
MVAFSFLTWFFLAAGCYTGSLLFYLADRNRSARVLLALGLATHTVSLILRSLTYAVFTPMNLFTELYFLPWLIACWALFHCCMPRWKAGKQLHLLFPLVLFTLPAILLPTYPLPPFIQSKSPFAILFFIFEVAAHGAFLMGGWFALRLLRSKTERTDYHLYAVWGFIFYSIAQVTGAVWCYQGWGVPFSWSERHLFSAATWCFYCAYLHLRFSRRWPEREKAWFVLFGGILVTVSIYAYYLVKPGGTNV